MARATGGRAGKKRMQRTETVSIRLDPRLNYLCELAARSQRRTKSSFIEAAIAEKIDHMQINAWRDDDRSLSLGDRADYLWHVRDSERLVSLGFAAPHLMTFEEQEIWAAICERGHFWRGDWVPDGNYEEWRWTCDERSIVRERVAENWEALIAFAEGDESALNSIPVVDERPLRNSAPPQERAASIDPDDEIPF